MKEVQTHRTPLANNNAAGIFFQPKLAINQPNDIYEHEADAVADKVMRMPETYSVVNDKKPFFSPPTVNINKASTAKEETLKKENKEEETEQPLPEIQAKLSFGGLPSPPDENKANYTGLIQRKCAHCEEEEKKMQRKEMNSSEIVANTSTENYISSLNGKGRPLTQNERSFFEPRFGYDFSNVQLHTNSEANQSAENINALAYTHGDNIVFGSNQYQPGIESGKKLIAHELTHVVQQNKENKTVHRSAAITSARFAPGNAPTTSISVNPSFIPGKWTIDMTTDAPGFTLESAVNVNCNGTAAGYEVGIVQVETQEFSQANYAGLASSDGSLIVSKSQVRKPPGSCIDARTGAFWTADASGEKSLKPPGCGMNIALPSFSDLPSESYKGWIENGLTHKPNYIRDIKMNMNFIDALAVKLPSGIINVLKWLKWSLGWEGKFSSNAAGSTPTGITQGTGTWIFGDDNIRPQEIPPNFAIPPKTCVDIAADATTADNVIETNASY